MVFTPSVPSLIDFFFRFWILSDVAPWPLKESPLLPPPVRVPEASDANERSSLDRLGQILIGPEVLVTPVQSSGGGQNQGELDRLS